MNNVGILTLLYKCVQCIDNAKADFHNVNQWTEDMGDGDTHEKRINLAFTELENGIKNILEENKSLSDTLDFFHRRSGE